MPAAAIQLDHRVYITSFPKSGTHLAEQMIGAIARPATSYGWLGTFQRNGWSTDWTPGSDRWAEYVPHFPAGGYLKGHTGYKPSIADALQQHGVATLFVFRDLRDVVVSQAHHALQTKGLSHPGRLLYASLPSFEEVILAVINGIGQWPGLVERWELYSGWLSESWVMPVRFEQMRYQTMKTARNMVDYVIGITTAFARLLVAPVSNAYANGLAAKMVERATRRKQSRTFRQGTSGGWREHFTPRICEAFDTTGAADWLVRLGYEQDKSWLTQH